MIKVLAENMLNTLPASLRNAFWKIYSADEAIPTLRRLQKCGFSPKSVVDGGAFRGVWTRKAKEVFPEAHVLMIEAQASKTPPLTQVCGDFSHTVTFATNLLGPTNEPNVAFYEMGTGSSVLEELTDAPREMTFLPMKTLDYIIQEMNFPYPELIKLDIQGYELEALKGAENTMNHAEVIYLEVSLLPYNQNAPLYDEVMAFMTARGFLPYDFCNLRRLNDLTLFQMDAIFVRKESALRHITFTHHSRSRLPPAN